ncbi:MAG: hypothetical protein M3Y48_09440 [Actinomycetota bacterium]|nr:hypothetical protein [Actinomycetota bacterium]
MTRPSGPSGEPTRLGVSGHRVLPSVALGSIIAGLREALVEAGAGLTGVTSLAAGSDQLFAIEVLAAGGHLHVVLPCQAYEETLKADDRTTYRHLLGQALTIETMPFEEPSEGAYFAAGCRVVDLCQRLLAVWDGQPARGLGGTADIVNYAREQGREVQVIWPAGTRR